MEEGGEKEDRKQKQERQTDRQMLKNLGEKEEEN